MTAKKTGIIEIAPIKVETATVRIVGDSSLIVHAWSEKAKRMMLDKQMKKASSGKEVRNPIREYADSLYWISEKPEDPTLEDIENGRFGFPAVAFKAAAIDAAYQQGVIDKKTTARGAFHITDTFGSDALVEIIGKPTMREDMVRLGGISSPADLRYRAEFPEWYVDLPIRYNPAAISIEQVMTMLNFGGFAVGVGEWRVAKDGQHGTFHVAMADEIA